jgi:deazaflavin-dependent oxidoreductase (nitroreductase family)
MAFKRWMYREGRPHGLAKLLNAGWGFLHARGIAPNYFVTLETVGRQSGKPVSLPLVMAVVDGERYLVSMLGEDANWVRNVKAAGGKARLRHGVTEEVLLEEVAVEKRAPILKAYLRRAPGARPHIPVDKDAPLAEFEKIASEYPVFRVKKAA